MPNRIEKVASQTMGVVKAAKACVEGVHGVFSQLVREHGEVTALLLRVKATSDAKVRGEFFPFIRAELLSHEQGELTVVYPAFLEHANLADFAEEHEEDATELEEQIELLTETAYDDERWQPRFDELVALVQAHVEKEEAEYFPAASKALGREKAEEMRARYEATKAKAAKE